MVHEIGKNNSILNHFISEIRDQKTQNDPMRFRKNMERISEILCYEMSKTLLYRSIEVTTPLACSEEKQCTEKIVIVSILRAGLSMHHGILNYFDKAENGFISAYRKEGKEHAEIEVIIEYLASPSIEGKTLILVDPMLATGTSLLLSLKALSTKGTYKNLHIISAIASQTAIDRLEKELPSDTNIWIAAVDPKINNKSYIVPGIGDAGDLAYGKKE